MLTTRPRGTNDIARETEKWHYVEKVLEICMEFDYQEIRFPIFEHTELFQEVWETTDIVEKKCIPLDRGQRYNFARKGQLYRAGILGA